MLQLRVDGGAGALADSRAESTRSRQQLREMRARMHEVQSVAQKQAVELSELRKNLPDSSVVTVTRMVASEVLHPGGTVNRGAEDSPMHATSQEDPRGMHTVSSSTCLDHHNLPQFQDAEQSPDRGSSPGNIQPCHNGLVGASGSQLESYGNQGPLGHLQQQNTCGKIAEDVGRVQYPESDRHCAPAASTAAQGQSSGLSESLAPVVDGAAAASSGNRHTAPSPACSRGESLRSSDQSTRTENRLFSRTKTIVTANAFFVNISEQHTAKLPTQAAPPLPPPAPGSAQDTSRHPCSPLSEVHLAGRLSTANGVAPVVVRRSAAGGAAYFRSAMDSAQEVRLDIALGGTGLLRPRRH